MTRMLGGISLARDGTKAQRHKGTKGRRRETTDFTDRHEYGDGVMEIATKGTKNSKREGEGILRC